VRTFLTIGEAQAALGGDKLGTVYHRVREGVAEVYVATQYGTGTFPRDEWMLRCCEACFRDVEGRQSTRGEQPRPGPYLVPRESPPS